MQSRSLFTSLLLLIMVQVQAQLKPHDVIRFCDSMLSHGINVPMIPGAIVGVSGSDSIWFSEGYGYSNDEGRIAVDPDLTLFQLGSVGKVFTAIAVLQQVEKGNLDLYRDVNDYLEGWQIENRFEEKVTLFHLLTHTGGFDDRVIGYLAKGENEVVPLSEHLMTNMPGQFQPPGTNINYSNYSYALAGHLVELASGKSFTKYVREEILHPLGMKESTYYLPDDYRERPEYARGYQWRETFEEVMSYPRHATPAGSIISTATDMSLFMQAILARDTVLLSDQSYELLLNQQFSNHHALKGYSLGMEVQRFSGHKGISKGGQIPGFLSVMLLFPDDNLGIFLSSNTETDNFMELFFEEFRATFFPQKKTTKVESPAKNIDEYVGHYGSERTSHRTLEALFMLFEGHFQFFRSEDGFLTAWHSGGWQKYNMTEEDVFRNISSSQDYVVFGRNENGDIVTMYRNVPVGGIQIPASYRRLGWFERPRFVNDEYPYVLLLIPSYLLLLPMWAVVWFVRRKRSEFLSGTKIPAVYHATAFLFLLLFTWNIIGFFLPLIQNRTDLLFYFDPALLSMRYFNWAMAAASVVLLILSGRLWFRKEGNVTVRLYYTLYSLASFSYILVLHKWHFLNITYQ